MKKISVIMAVVLILCFLSPTYADEGISPMYTNTLVVYAALSINGSTAGCWGDVTAYSSSASCTVTVRLQRQTDGLWATMKIWSGSGSGYAAAGDYYTVMPGTYRVFVSAKVDGESSTLYSPVKVVK